MAKHASYRQYGNGRYVIKNQLLNQCWKMWHSCVLTRDGIVVPCCFYKDAYHRLGNLKEQSFKEIWNGPLYNQFRSLILKGRDQIDICKNCTEGCKVWESA